MPRENLSGGGEPNPSCRFFEWNGETGNPFFYCKEKKQKVQLPCDFTFILLNRLGVVKGWHEGSQSGITSNEVLDTRSQPLIVRSFKGGKIAEGLYADIKDRVKVAGGSFNASCYIAFKDGQELKIGNIMFRGGALGAWFEFEKSSSAELYTKAVRINGFTEGKKGAIKFRMPKFELMPIKQETDDIAGELQKELQAYHAKYFARTHVAQAEAVQSHPAEHVQENPPDDEPPMNEPEPESESVPF